MTDETRKQAIILRGPPATGKSKVAEELLNRLQKHNLSMTSERIELDRNYQSRCQGEHRYDDITAKEQEAVVVIEICCGELIFTVGNTYWLLDARLGPMRNPVEWVAMLRDQGRDIYGFLLWASWSVVRTRNDEREKERSLHTAYARMLYDFYSLADWRTFPDKAGVAEKRLDMEQLNVQTAADEILKDCGLP